MCVSSVSTVEIDVSMGRFPSAATVAWTNCKPPASVSSYPCSTRGTSAAEKLSGDTISGAKALGFDIVHRASSDYVAHLCVARHAHRETVRQALKQAGIDTAIHYPVPDHRQPALEQVSWRSGGLQITERVQSEIMTLPCYAEMTEEEVDYVGFRSTRLRQVDWFTTVRLSYLDIVVT